MNPSPAQPGSSARGLPWAATLALAAALRLAGLPAALLGDEYMQAFFALASRGPREFLHAIRGNPHHMLIDPASTWLASGLGGGAAWLRIPSLAWGLAAFYGLRRLAEEGGARRLALPAALLLAVSAMHGEWSYRIDFYAALCALTLWQSVLLLRLEADPTKRLGYGACAAVFLHAHPYALFVLALHGVYLALSRSKRRARSLASWSLALAAAGALALPWFLWSARAALHPLDFWGQKGSPTLAGFLTGAPFYLAATTEPVASSGAARLLEAALAAAWAAAWAASALGRERERPPALRLARAIVLPGLGLVVASDYAFQMYLAPRQLIWILPFYLLEVSDGAAALAERVSTRTARALAAAALAAAVGTRAAQTLHESRDASELQAVVTAVAASCRPGDALRFDDSLTAAGFLYHFDRAAFGRQPALRSAPPDGARCADGRALVLLDGQPRPGRPVWRFHGTLEDFSVEAPPGRWP